MPLRGLVVGREGEGRGVAPPAGQRLPEAVGMARMHPDEGRRAGAAIEVLVAAADREVGIGAAQVDFDTAPALCARSQTMSAPAACARRVTAAMSCMAPVR
jgi:hypothetical protein